MADSYYQLQVDAIKSILSGKTSLQYLKEQITLPQFDDDRIVWMSYMMRNSHIETKERHSYIAATMLAQLALDIHDYASDSHIPFKQRQLSILAGDYFSGIYYNLLSEYENLPLIQSLALAIKEINEYKIKLHHDKDQNIDSFFANLKKIESALLKQFCAFFQSGDYYNQFIDEFLFLKKILNELKNINNGYPSLIMEKLKSISIESNKMSNLQVNQRNMKESLTYATHSLQTLERLAQSNLNLPDLIQVRLKDLKIQLENISGMVAEEG